MDARGCGCVRRSHDRGGRRRAALLGPGDAARPALHRRAARRRGAPAPVRRRRRGWPELPRLQPLADPAVSHVRPFPVTLASGPRDHPDDPRHDRRLARIAPGSRVRSGRSSGHLDRGAGRFRDYPADTVGRGQHVLPGASRGHPRHVHRAHRMARPAEAARVGDLLRPRVPRTPDGRCCRAALPGASAVVRPVRPPHSRIRLVLRPHRRRGRIDRAV